MFSVRKFHDVIVQDDLLGNAEFSKCDSSLNIQLTSSIDEDDWSRRSVMSEISDILDEFESGMIEEQSTDDSSGTGNLKSFCRTLWVAIVFSFSSRINSIA